MRNLPAAVRLAYEESPLNQAEICRKIDCSESLLSKLKNADDPSKKIKIPAGRKLVRKLCTIPGLTQNTRNLIKVAWLKDQAELLELENSPENLKIKIMHTNQPNTNDLEKHLIEKPLDDALEKNILALIRCCQQDSSGKIRKVIAEQAKLFPEILEAAPK